MSARKVYFERGILFLPGSCACKEKNEADKLNIKRVARHCLCRGGGRGEGRVVLRGVASGLRYRKQYRRPGGSCPSFIREVHSRSTLDYCRVRKTYARVVRERCKGQRERRGEGKSNGEEKKREPCTDFHLDAVVSAERLRFSFLDVGLLLPCFCRLFASK